MKTLHNNELPNETTNYRLSRNELLDEEVKLRLQIEKVASMRRDLPLGGKVNENYLFNRANGDVKLAELFGEHNSLILYSFMYGPNTETPCPMCVSIIDALNANAQAIGQRASIAIVAKSGITKITNFANQRGWHNIQLLSSGSNTYNIDYYGEDAEGNQWPMCNVFIKRDEDIYHSYATEIFHLPPEEGEDARHVDMMWPLYNYLDLTPEGRGDWYPKLTY